MLFRSDVEAVVNSIVQVNVGVAGRAEDHLCSLRDAGGGVRGRIAGSQIRFGFHDLAGAVAVHEDFAQKIAGDFYCGAGVELSLEDRHCG